MDGAAVGAGVLEGLAVAVDLRLPLTGRPLLGVDGDPRRLGVQLPGLDAAGDVPDVVVVSVGRGFARERVLAAKLSVLRIGEPPIDRPPVGVVVASADGPQAFAIGDALADVFGQALVEEGGAGHTGSWLSGERGRACWRGQRRRTPWPN